MKRLLVLTVIAICAVPAFAFDPISPGNRIGVLARVERDERYEGGEVLRTYLMRELRRHGFDAFNTRYNYDDLVRDGRSEADFYVELLAHGGDWPVGGVGVGDRHAGVDIAVIRSFSAARIRIYDGRSFEIVDEFEVRKRNTTVVPASVGIGGRHLGLWVALPFIQHARYRAAARAVARDAADQIAGVNRDEARPH